MDNGDDSDPDNGCMESEMLESIVGMDILFPGHSEYVKDDIFFQDENGQEFTVADEKKRLLESQNITEPLPENFIMLIVLHSDGQERLPMRDEENIKYYKDDLSDGHIEFQNK